MGHTDLVTPHPKPGATSDLRLRSSCGWRCWDLLDGPGPDEGVAPIAPALPVVVAVEAPPPVMKARILALRSRMEPAAAVDGLAFDQGEPDLDEIIQET